MSFAIFCRKKVHSWPDGCSRISDRSPGTFHMRNAAMAPLLEAMRFAQVIDDDHPWDEPDWPPPGLTSERADALDAHFFGDEPLDPPIGEEERRIWTAYQAQRDASSAARSPDAGRVPGWKFSSNDGWIVTIEEAQTIARALTHLLACEDELEMLLDILDFDIEEGNSFALYLAQWACFNAAASKLEGYTVS